MATKKQAAGPRRKPWRAFVGLEGGSALWRTPEGQWVVVWRGERVYFVLNTRGEWNRVVAEGESALTADASGRVWRDGAPVAPGDPAWVVPPEVRAHAVF
jgi:hypothetical protein